MKSKLIVFASFLVPLMANADQVDPRTAFLSALQGQVGKTYSTSISFGGLGFGQLSQQSGSDSPFVFDVTKILDYPEKGCGKLKLVISQINGFKQPKFSMTQYMSICSDGTPYAHPDMSIPKE